MLLFLIKRILFFVLVVVASIGYSQDVTITGKQIKENIRTKPTQLCTPVKITGKMKVSEVEGDCTGFWIQKGSETVYKFDNKKDALGTILTPGVYYVYPYLETDKKKANVTITIVRNNNSS